jgi:hypothetical protein
MSLPPPSLPPPQPGPAAFGQPAAVPTKQGMGGCAKALIVAAILFVVLGLTVVVLGVLAVNWLGNKAEEVLSSKPCPFLSDGAAQDVLGNDAKAEQLGLLTQGALAIVTDTRVLAEAPSCYVTAKTIGSARVARTDGGHDRFAAERQNAEPQTEDRGGGLSVTREGWFGSTVENVGDEGFCTTMDPTGAVGALIRKGDTLVYASISPTEFDQSQVVIDPQTGAITNPTECQLAQQLAERTLG